MASIEEVAPFERQFNISVSESELKLILDGLFVVHSRYQNPSPELPDKQKAALQRSWDLVDDMKDTFNDKLYEYEPVDE